jgi:hypothetical protein
VRRLLPVRLAAAGAPLRVLLLLLFPLFLEKKRCAEKALSLQPPARGPASSHCWRRARGFFLRACFF